MEIILSDAEYRALPREVELLIHNCFSEENTVSVCNNCGCFIANFLKDKDESLPNDVFHSHGYQNRHLSTVMELCVKCNSKMQTEIQEIKEKYRDGFENNKKIKEGGKK